MVSLSNLGPLLQGMGYVHGFHSPLKAARRYESWGKCEQSAMGDHTPGTRSSSVQSS